MHKSTFITGLLLTLFILLGLVFAIMNGGQLEGRFSTEYNQHN
jgi:hypothetical protein